MKRVSVERETGGVYGVDVEGLRDGGKPCLSCFDGVNQVCNFNVAKADRMKSEKR